jgi:endonuclease IV
MKPAAFPERQNSRRRQDVASYVSTTDASSSFPHAWLELDRHRHIGKGTTGRESFRILLNDLRLADAAFIAETPIDQPGADRRNIQALKRLVAADLGSQGFCAHVLLASL